MAKSLLRPVVNQPRLADLLEYRNLQVVRYFCHRYSVPRLEDGERILQDLLAWMWITLERKTLERHTFMFGPLQVLDNMWHAFILHTRDYHAFCNQYFGQYFHHDMEPVGAEYSLSPDDLADFLDSCFEHLGEDWIMRYFGEPLHPRTRVV